MATFRQVNLTFHWHCEAVHEWIPIKSLPQEWLSSCKHLVKARLEGIGWTSTMHYCEEENCMGNKSFFHPRISNRAVFLLYSKEQTRRTQILIHPGLTVADISGSMKCSCWFGAKDRMTELNTHIQSNSNHRETFKSNQGLKTDITTCNDMQQDKVCMNGAAIWQMAVERSEDVQGLSGEEGVTGRGGDQCSWNLTSLWYIWLWLRSSEELMFSAIIYYHICMYFFKDKKAEYFCAFQMCFWKLMTLMMFLVVW